MGLNNLSHFPIHHHAAHPEKDGEPVPEVGFDVLEYADGIQIWHQSLPNIEFYDTVEEAVAEADRLATAFEERHYRA